MTEIPAIYNTETRALMKAAQEERSDIGKLLKFIKGHYGVGDDEVPLGYEYSAHIDQWMRGWVKFEDNTVTEKRIGRAADDFKVPEREELGDLDEAKWEMDATGKPRDPWTLQSYLPFEDLENGEIVIFVSGSQGGRSAIANLVKVAARYRQRGQPIIKLAVRSYKHKQFGRIETPDFPIIGWTGAANPSNQDEMNDRVPY